MSNLHYTKIRDEDGEQITVFLAGDLSHPYVAHDSHPAWDRILAMVDEDDPNVISLFDMARAVAERMALSERVSYGAGRLFFDGDSVDDALTQHIVRTVQAEEDASPLVALFENIALNPSESSREQMYRFLKANDFTITYDGLIVGYKSVYHSDDSHTRREHHAQWAREPQAQYMSSSQGTAIVNGKVQIGQIKQSVGDVVEMPRKDVVEDPSTACSVGLHVATFGFAQSFLVDGVVLEVHVHPRDVVSVPANNYDDKVRVCRYRVIGERTEPYSVPVLPPPTLVEPISVPVTVPMASDVKHPDEAEFSKMVARAKRRRRGVVRYLSKMTDWHYDGGDPKDLHSWSVS